jgi:hypothetical protein
MALAPYTESYWYPDETFAVGVEYHVFPRFSNVHAPLFQDQAGTIPLPNPGLTAAGGVISFFVENGDYWIKVGINVFYLIIDLDPNLTHVWPSTFRWVQAAPAAVWVINHGLNSFPSVNVLDPLNQELFGQVDYVDDDNLTITFSSPESGTAFLRR